MKKLLSIILAIVMIMSVSTIAFAKNNSEVLQFNEDGKFKICVLADPRDGHPTSEAMLRYICEVLDDRNPDLVVLLGDNITKDSENMESYEELLNPIVERGIPFTFVFGNHDDHCCEWSKEEILKVFRKFDGCLAYDVDENLHGCATHNLPILSSNGEKTAFNLWMIDSGDYLYDENGERLGYDCVRKDRLDWYEAESKKLEEENGGKVPSLVFRHIVTEEVIGKIFVPFIGINPGFKVDEDFNDHTRLGFPFKDGKTYTMIPNLGTLNGLIMEMGCPSFENDGQWDVMKNRGDVLGVVTGHDHKSNFEVDVDGIKAVQVSACTYAAYHNLWLTNIKTITIDENDPWNFETENHFACDVALKDGSKIAGLDGIGVKEYKKARTTNHFLTGLMKVLNAMFFWTKIFK